MIYSRISSQPISALSNSSLIRSTSESAQSPTFKVKAPSYHQHQRGRALQRTGNSTERRTSASTSTSTYKKPPTVHLSSYSLPPAESDDLLFDDIELQSPSLVDSDPIASTSASYFQSRERITRSSTSLSSNILCNCFDPASYSSSSSISTFTPFEYNEQSEYSALLRSQTRRVTQRRASSSTSTSSSYPVLSRASSSHSSSSSSSSSSSNSSSSPSTASGTAMTLSSNKQQKQDSSSTSPLSTSSSSAACRASRRRQRRLKDFEDRLLAEEEEEEDEQQHQEEQEQILNVISSSSQRQRQHETRTEYFYINADNLPEARSVPEYDESYLYNSSDLSSLSARLVPLAAADTTTTNIINSHPAYDDYYTFKPHVLVAKLEALLLASPSLSPSSSDVTLPELSEGSASSDEEEHDNDSETDIDSDETDVDVDEYLLTSSNGLISKNAANTTTNSDTNTNKVSSKLPLNPLVRIRSDKYTAAADEDFQSRFERAMDFADFHNYHYQISNSREQGRNHKAFDNKVPDMTVPTRGRQRERQYHPTQRSPSDTVRNLLASLAS